MSQLTIIYNLYDDADEVQAMFTHDGKLLDYWSLTDANWRDEYFNPFMRRLGIVVKPTPNRLQSLLLTKLRDARGV